MCDKLDCIFEKKRKRNIFLCKQYFSMLMWRWFLSRKHFARSVIFYCMPLNCRRDRRGNTLSLEKKNHVYINLCQFADFIEIDGWWRCIHISWRSQSFKEGNMLTWQYFKHNVLIALDFWNLESTLILIQNIELKINLLRW